jgi:hypothetical protein
MHVATAPVKPAAVVPLDAAPDAQEQLPLPQGFLLTRGVLTLSAPSDADAPTSTATTQSTKKATKKGTEKPGVAVSNNKPAELKESAAGRRRRRKKNSAENDPTNPLNPAVAATLLNNAAAASSKDVTKSKTQPSITMHVKGIKVLVNPKNETEGNCTQNQDLCVNPNDASVVVAPAVAANKAAWPQDTTEKDFEKNGKHADGFPKDHKKREDWNYLMGPSLFAPPNKTASKKPAAGRTAPAPPKVRPAAKKPPAQKSNGQRQHGGGDTLVTAKSLVTRVSPMPPLAGWGAVAPAVAGKNTPQGKKPAAKPGTKQKKPSPK